MSEVDMVDLTKRRQY